MSDRYYPEPSSLYPELRAKAERGVERMALGGESYTESIAVKAPTLLALLDVAEILRGMVADGHPHGDHGAILWFWDAEKRLQALPREDQA